jgi:hypothetical protein
MVSYAPRVRFDWDPDKDAANRSKHGIGFREATVLFESGGDYLEVIDASRADGEHRFVAIGPVVRGIVYVVFTVRDEDVVRIISARRATAREIEAYLRHMRGRRP